jgi:hypothetical protein
MRLLPPMPLLHAAISKWTPIVLISFPMTLTMWVWNSQSKHRPAEAAEPFSGSSAYTAMTDTKALVEAVLGDSVDDAVERSNSDQARWVKISRRPRLVTALIIRHELPRSSRGLTRDLDLAARDDQPQTLTALYHRASALDRLGFDSAALRDWHAYLAVDSTSRRADMARRRATAASAKLKSVPALFHDTSYENDRIVLNELAMGRSHKALAILDAGREWKPSERRTFQEELAVEYSRVGNTLLIWTASQHGIQVTRTVVDTVLWAQTQDELQKNLQRGASDTEIRPALSLLYELFVRPIEPLLGTDTSLAIVKDGVAGVPFPASYDVRREEYLVENRAVRQLTSRSEALHYRNSARGTLVSAPALEPSDSGKVESLPGEIGLVYARIADTLLIWTALPKDIRVYRAVIDTIQLAQTLDALRQDFERGAPEQEVRPALSLLYDLLVRPV